MPGRSGGWVEKGKVGEIGDIYNSVNNKIYICPYICLKKDIYTTYGCYVFPIIKELCLLFFLCFID